MTSVSGTSDLSTWPDAQGAQGLAAADAICRSRAQAGGLPDAERYIALLSDSHDDAYCRLHGAAGKVADNCNQSELPTGAGPWYRIDGLAQRDVVQNSGAAYPNVGYVPRAIVFDETGAPTPGSNTTSAFTGTNTDYVGFGDLCSDWTSTQDAGDDMAIAFAYAGFGDVATSLWHCGITARLICLESDTRGDPLPRHRPSTARAIFYTSSTGNGNLSTWPDAGGAHGLDAGDNICREHAARANLPLANTFKAWLSTSQTGAGERLQFDGPFVRTDGVPVAESVAELTGGFLQAPIQFNELGTFGPSFFEDVWTGTNSDGAATSYNCGDWTSGRSTIPGHFGQTYLSDGGWTLFVYEDLPLSCDYANAHLYCLGDNDSIFVDGFE